MIKYFVRSVKFILPLALAYVLFLGVLAMPALDKFPHVRYYFLDRKIVKLVTAPSEVLEADFNDGFNILRFRELEKTGPVDLLFLGSSHAYLSFDPRVFRRYGLSSFNLGNGSQTPLNSYYLFETYRPRLKPKLVELDVYPIVLESRDGLESFCELVVSTPMTWGLTRMALATGSVHALNAYTFEWARRLWFPLARRSQMDLSPQRYVSAGFVLDDQVYDGKTAFKNRKLKLAKKQLRYLKKILATVRRSGSKIVLVTSPYPEGFRKSFTNYDEVSESFKTIAEKNGVSYYDFNYRMDTQNNALFSDKSHLNGRGAEKFCHLLMRVLGSDPRYSELTRGQAA